MGIKKIQITSAMFRIISKLSSYLFKNEVKVIRRYNTNNELGKIKINEYCNLLILGHKLLLNNTWPIQYNESSKGIEQHINAIIKDDNKVNRNRIIKYISNNCKDNDNYMLHKMSIFEKRVVSDYLLKIYAILKENNIDITLLQNELTSIPSHFAKLLPLEYVMAFSNYFATHHNLTHINSAIKNQRLNASIISAH